jgi:hypothetical protein
VGKERRWEVGKVRKLKSEVGMRKWEKKEDGKLEKKEVGKVRRWEN